MLTQIKKNMHIYGKQIRGHINTYMEFYASIYIEMLLMALCFFMTMKNDIQLIFNMMLSTINTEFL